MPAAPGSTVHDFENQLHFTAVSYSHHRRLSSLQRADRSPEVARAGPARRGPSRSRTLLAAVSEEESGHFKGESKCHSELL